MEPITWGWILAAALSGVIGNKADKTLDVAVGRGLQGFAQRLQPQDKPVCDLQKAVRYSFISAQQSLAWECLQELTGGGKVYRGQYVSLPGCETEVAWLRQKLKLLDGELKQVEPIKSVEEISSFQEIESLLTPEGALAADGMQAVQKQLIVTMGNEQAPGYQAKLADPDNGLLERMRRYFAAEIVSNPVLNNLVQGQLLSQINANLKELQAQQISKQDWQNSWQDLARNVSQEITQIRQYLEKLQPRAAVPLQFESLIADKTAGFVGREFVFAAIERFLQTQPNGYFIIEADPGVGKSAILAEYVRQTGCVAHFNVRSQGITRTEQFLQSVCGQLIERYRLPYPTPIPGENTRDGNFLARLLHEIRRDVACNVSTPQHNAPIIIAVDALDEVELTSQTAGANLLYLPASLPHGVYFILTKRPLPLPLPVNKYPIFDLMQYKAESLQDLQRYIRQRVTDTRLLQEWIAQRGLSVDEFVTILAEKSDRNFMYLRYVLPEIANGAYQDLNKIENLPQGLEQYYYQHWQNMGMTAKPLPRDKIKIVYVLAEALEPVSCQLISELAGEDSLTVQEVLDEWGQFLREQRIDGLTRYSIYHASFQDFLHCKEIVKRAGETIQDVNARFVDSLTQGQFEDG
ncbi:MAG: ATP-binding protein [Coleofasciculaceae cyanobacterium]